ncbi:MAG TPA: HPr family phosphocarrier protein [Chthoniobacterales bacterium]|jgi:phosphocarrier protein
MNGAGNGVVGRFVKHSTVTIPWEAGLHLRPAARLVRVAQCFRSTISLRSGGRIADVRNILSVVALCATMGTTLDLVTNGDDEQAAAAAVEQVFRVSDDGHRDAGPGQRA